MALIPDWGNRIIHVPQADLTSLGGDSYQLDTEAFKIALRELEDSEQGMMHPKIINHNTTVLLSGIEYARIIEVINGYTITFEDVGSPYKVFFIGSNNNILDVTNLNNVSVAPSNSAGLINVREVQQGMFTGEAVHVNTSIGKTGTLYPIGTSLPGEQSNNIPDSVSIASIRGLHHLVIEGSLVLGSGDDVSNYTLIGQNATSTFITCNSDAIMNDCTIFDAVVTGNLDGGTLIERCVIYDLNYVNGFVYKTMINPGTISLGGTNTAHFLECFSGVPGISTPTIDMDGSGSEDTPLAIRGYNGGIKLIHKTGTASCSIDLVSGQVIIELATCTNGLIVVRGNGKVIDEFGNHLVSGMYGNLEILNECNYGGHVHDIWEVLGLNPDSPITIGNGSYISDNLVIDVVDNGNGTYTLNRQ